MTVTKRFSIFRPTMETPFHVDFEWWKQNERDWHVYLHSLMCVEHQESLAEIKEGELIDYVNPQTAEIKQVDGIQHTLLSHCVKQPEFLSGQTALVEAVFRLFLINDNRPMTVEELGEKLGRPPQTILRTLSGPRIYKGLRPVQ